MFILPHKSINLHSLGKKYDALAKCNYDAFHSNNINTLYSPDNIRTKDRESTHTFNQIRHYL